MKNAGVWLAAALAVGATELPAQQIEVRRVAEGVYAALQPAAMRFDDSNSLIVVLDDGVLIVDTQNSPAAANAVLAEVRKLTDKPVRWVVNTHWHGDHVQGSQVYRAAFPSAEFIGHATTGEDITGRAATLHAQDMRDVPGWIERAKAALASGVADGQTMTEAQKEQLRGRLQRREAFYDAIRQVTQFVVPTRTVSDSLTLAGGRVVIKHFEGHTRGDLVVWLPRERVLATGDLLDDLPFTGHGSPRALLGTLAEFEKLNFQTMVPGHGSVRTSQDHLKQVTALFTAIVNQTGAAAGEGLNLEDTRKRVDLSSFRSYFVTDDVSARYWDAFTGEGIRKAWEEATAGR